MSSWCTYMYGVHGTHDNIPPYYTYPGFHQRRGEGNRQYNAPLGNYGGIFLYIHTYAQEMDTTYTTILIHVPFLFTSTLYNYYYLCICCIQQHSERSSLISRPLIQNTHACMHACNILNPYTAVTSALDVKEMKSCGGVVQYTRQGHVVSDRRH